MGTFYINCKTGKLTVNRCALQIRSAPSDTFQQWLFVQLGVFISGLMLQLALKPIEMCISSKKVCEQAESPKSETDKVKLVKVRSVQSNQEFFY